MTVLTPLQEVDVGRGWRVAGDPSYNEPNTYIDVESDMVFGLPVFIVTGTSDLWEGAPMPIGLTLEGAVALIVALEREIARDPEDAEQVAPIRERLAASSPPTSPREGES